MATARARNAVRTHPKKIAVGLRAFAINQTGNSQPVAAMSRTIEAITKHTGAIPEKDSSAKYQTMKAIRIHNYGGPEVLQYEDAPRPKPQAGEVLIRVHAAGVNPIDWKVREGHMKDFWPHKLPLILGWDLSGVVEEVGPRISQFKKGDEVYSLPDPTRNGAYADYIVVREPELALKPNSLHDIRAAAVPLAALTGWQSLFDTAQLQPGQRVLIHAGSGGVGHFAVQLAKWKGAYVFATASTKNQDLLRELGVDEPIDYTQQRFEDVGRNIDIVLDTLGGETQERSWSVLKKGGVLVSLVQPPSEEKAEELGVRAAIIGAQPNGAQLARIAKIIDAGQLAPVIDRILPLSEVRRAHELSQSGHTHGKIALRVSNGKGTLERKQS
jgi:NADPH:quinone reductase-like Zn-dependent oxidoreductase